MRCRWSGLGVDVDGGGSVVSVNAGRGRRRFNCEPSGSPSLSVATAKETGSMATPFALCLFVDDRKVLALVRWEVDHDLGKSAVLWRDRCSCKF